MKVAAASRSGVVRALPFAGDDAALLEGIRAGHSGAVVALVDRYGPHMQRVLCRVLGPDDELGDVLHDSIAHALANIEDVREPESLKAWLTQVAVYSARGVIRRRRRRRWLSFWSPADLPEIESSDTSPESWSVMKDTYAILAQLPEDERIAFSLRFIEQMELRDVAEALGTSLATIKRVLRRAEDRFAVYARRYPAVLEAIEEGTRFKEKG